MELSKININIPKYIQIHMFLRPHFDLAKFYNKNIRIVKVLKISTDRYVLEHYC